MEPTDEELTWIYQHFHIDPSDIPYATLKKGFLVELEHGSVSHITNLTDDDLIKTTKIVLAHLREGIRYYDLLEELELTLKKEHQIPRFFTESQDHTDKK